MRALSSRNFPQTPKEWRPRSKCLTLGKELLGSRHSFLVLLYVPVLLIHSQKGRSRCLNLFPLYWTILISLYLLTELLPLITSVSGYDCRHFILGIRCVQYGAQQISATWVQNSLATLLPRCTQRLLFCSGHPDPNIHTETILITALHGQWLRYIPIQLLYLESTHFYQSVYYHQAVAYQTRFWCLSPSAAIWHFLTLPFFSLHSIWFSPPSSIYSALPWAKAASLLTSGHTERNPTSL